MRRPDLENLENLTLPPGYQVRTYREGDEAAWASIINASFGEDKWNAERCRNDLTSRPQSDPEGTVLCSTSRRACGNSLRMATVGG